MKIKLNIKQVANAYYDAQRIAPLTKGIQDFHDGSEAQNFHNNFIGKLGEEAFKFLLVERNKWYKEDRGKDNRVDKYDFMVKQEGQNRTIDVKTRDGEKHRSILEFKKRIDNGHGKDIYISMMHIEPFTIEVLGYALREDFLELNIVKNFGWDDNYSVPDNKLRKLSTLFIDNNKWKNLFF